MTLLTAVAVLVGIVASARLTRLVVHDTFPPVQWLVDQYIKLIRGNEKWSTLVECHWCIAPWIIAPNLAWAVLSELHWSWWVFNGWLAAAYAASWIVEHDQD